MKDQKHWDPHFYSSYSRSVGSRKQDQIDEAKLHRKLEVDVRSSVAATWATVACKL